MADKIKNYVAQSLKSDKNIKVFTVIGLGIIGLIFIFTIFPPQSTEEIILPTSEADEYISELEFKVQEILQNIEGVGYAKVMITIENSSEIIYQTENKTATDTKTNDSGTQDISSQSEENLVMIDGVNGQNEALVKTEIPPKIKGIAVICAGGGDVTVVNQITQTLKAIFDINSTNISVAKLANTNLNGGEEE